MVSDSVVSSYELFVIIFSLIHQDERYTAWTWYVVEVLIRHHNTLQDSDVHFQGLRFHIHCKLHPPVNTVVFISHPMEYKL